MSTNEDKPIEFVRDRAAFWAVRMNEGDLSESELEQFQRWLLEDSRHAEEFRAARNIQSVAMELPTAAAAHLVALDPVREDEAAETPLWRRRHVMALAASVVVAVAGAGWLSFRASAGHVSYVTKTAEMRDVTFADGSVAHMNTRTRLEWLGDVDDRRVRLLEGEALFDVVPDEARPFRVLLDNSEIQVLGTSFNVYRKKNGETVVTVLEGHVRVRGRNEVWERDLRRGQQLVYRSIGPMTHALETDVADAVGWRTGVIEVKSRPLAEVIEELTRYTDREILIPNPDVAAEPFTGVLDIRDVREALSRIELSDRRLVVSENNGVFTIDWR